MLLVDTLVRTFIITSPLYYYKPMMYYKPTALFSSKFLYCIGCLYSVYGIFVRSLACSDPLRALRGGEGLAKLALDCVFTDQSDFTEAIRSNYIHSLHGRVRV